MDCGTVFAVLILVTLLVFLFVFMLLALVGFTFLLFVFVFLALLGFTFLLFVFVFLALLGFTFLLFVFVLLLLVSFTRLLGLGGCITLVFCCALFTTFPLDVFKVFSRLTFLSTALIFLGVAARERERVIGATLLTVPGLAVATRLVVPGLAVPGLAVATRLVVPGLAVPGLAVTIPAGVFGRPAVFGTFAGVARFAGVFGRFAVLGVVFGLFLATEVPGGGFEVAVLFTFIPDDALELFDLVKTDLELRGFLFLTALMTLYFPDIFFNPLN